MIVRPLLIALGLLAGTLAAETRVWRNADASSSFSGDYVAHDSQRVTIRRGDGREFTLELRKLHAADRQWLARRGVAAAAGPASAPDPSAVFDTLCFGDSRKVVEAKLKASKLVEATIDETFFGRFGLNGSFRTVKKIGGLHCELYFDWSEEGGLKEVSLQTQALGRDAYGESLQRNWSELADLLTTLHGKPLQRAGYPPRTDLQDDLFLASHLWRLEGGGSALLGTSMQAGRYMVVVRFTTEGIRPVVTP